MEDFDGHGDFVNLTLIISNEWSHEEFQKTFWEECLVKDSSRNLGG